MSRRLDYRALFVAAVVSLSAPAAAAGQTTPPWQTRLMPWFTHAGQPRPWRDDPRLAGHAARGFPDDFPISFANPDSARGGLHEVMWVRAIAYDRATDLYLGVLLNQPHYLESVVAGDNVVFRAEPKLTAPARAVGAPDYVTAGWPVSRNPAYFVTLRDGIRAYRNGNSGHNQPEIERCVRVLLPAVQAMPADVSAEERFVSHFVLGRCLAEKYETERAAGQFRAAIALDSSDVDSHMALLAELSIMTHRPPGSQPADVEARQEREFVDELALVRARFPTDDGVRRILGFVFDPAQEADAGPQWKPHVAKLRRVGYATFRWKQR